MNNQKLTIGFVLDDGLDRPDGVQQYILTVGNWMATQGHSVYYLVGETTRSDLVNVYSLSKNLKVRFNGNTLSTPLPAKKKTITKLFSDISFDVLHVQVPYSPFMAAKVVLAAPKSVAVVGTFHILPYGTIQELGTKLLRVSLGRSIKRFDKFLSVSSAAHVFAKNSFRVDSEVVPNTVDLKKFKPTAKKARTQVVKIVFLGRLVERKGCMQLLQAIKYAKDHGLFKPDFHLDIYGKGRDSDSLVAFSSQSGINDIVSFHGFIDEADKPAALQAADIAVFPSTGAESFGIVLIEAMAAGSGVVLGGNNPGYRTVLNEIPETLVDPLDTPKFANQLADFVNNPKLRNQTHARQQETVKQYDIEVVGQKILDVYLDCKNKREV